MKGFICRISQSQAYDACERVFHWKYFFFLNHKQPSIKILFSFFYLAFYSESGKPNEVKDLY